MKWLGSVQRRGRTVAKACLALTLVLGAAAIAGDQPTADWWSFKPPVKPPLPAATDWCKNELDYFIAARHREQHLTPSAEADRRVLLRRVTFDLTGLAPSLQELEAFLKDRSTNAYEQVVDRLLASPRYGERWARHWLDTVHYGESHGYDKDKPRLNAWPYRDYVIRSFNSDKRYSRFVQEQLAGDVLYPNDPDGVVALGFIAAGPWDFVGHVELPITKTDGLIARYNDRDDMVMNTMSTFQSLTVHCARCHDHKFDPITQRDYYSLQAVFAGVDRADRPYDSDPVIAAKRARLSADLAAATEERRALQANVDDLGGEPLRTLVSQTDAASRSNKASTAAFGYHSAISQEQNAIKWAQVDLGASKEISAIEFAGCHDDFNNIGAGFGFPPRYKIEASDDAEFRSGVESVVDHSNADVTNPGVSAQRIAARTRGRYVRFTATKLAPRKDDYIFALAELIVVGETGENLARGRPVMALDSIEAPPRWRKANLVDGYYVGAPAQASVAQLERERDALLRERIPAELLAKLRNCEQRLASAKAAMAELPKAQWVYAAAREFSPSGSFVPAKKPRPVNLLRRGDVKKPGDEVKPAAVAAVAGPKAEFAIADLSDESQRRAALARWITDTNNMLARRSIVNRVWAYHFGRGIVDTPNDFGRMGGVPSHPELLDWLGFWFLEHDESLKALHRLIVTSAAYRQASDSNSREHALADGQNRFLGRMNRPRMDAEQFHDAVLSIAGNLDLTMGGPSIQQFAFKDDHSPVYDYAKYDLNNSGARRRSIYRFIVRSVPDPFMEALDCPDANTLTPARTVTTTALQALATWNDAFLLRQCEELAAGIERDSSEGNEQVSRCFERILLRKPAEAEKARFAAHAARHGLSSVCRILFNSNEFMFID